MQVLKQRFHGIKRGTAVMPFVSLINHSCNSNIFRQSRPKHTVIYATHPIQKDEQLFDTYLKQCYASMSTYERKQKLLQNYYFKCDCIPCQEDWPSYDKLQSFETLVKSPEDKAKIEEALRMFGHIYAIHLKTEGNVQDKPNIIEDLLKMVQVLHDYAPMPCKEMSNVVGVLKRAYILNGNIFEIPQVWTYGK